MTLPSRIDYLSISCNENKWAQAKDSFYGDSVPPEMKLTEKQPEELKENRAQGGWAIFCKMTLFQAQLFWLLDSFGLPAVKSVNFHLSHQWRMNKTEFVTFVSLIGNFLMNIRKV